ncbi:hypothetical protein AKJ09_02417 [Labilithrix luteola]|uniref:Uncharacterized protein n=1 Tax=Labilithrix luteola TaxID=1391654 RepID=A0A0K1PQF5_9BACT|nr:hypothetical protein AKJ09_02417 [Labilithrix luteola]
MFHRARKHSLDRVDELVHLAWLVPLAGRTPFSPRVEDCATVHAVENLLPATDPTKSSEFGQDTYDCVRLEHLYLVNVERRVDLNALEQWELPLHIRREGFNRQEEGARPNLVPYLIIRGAQRYHPSSHCSIPSCTTTGGESTYRRIGGVAAR